MNIKLRKILIVTLALAAAICLSLGLAACNTATLTGLTVENYRFEFLVGDTFEFGEGFTVYANYSDGTKVDVTEEIDKQADIKFETGFNMDEAGDYQITVSYQGKKAVYTIYVGTFTNVLLRLELDTQNVKTQYKLGESISFDNLKISSTYENAQGKEITQTTSGLKGFTATIINDESGNSTEDVLNEFGDFTVTVLKNGIKASYKINVDGVDISTVQGAVVTGAFFKDKIASGSLKRLSQLADNTMVQTHKTEYKFGNNYTYVKEYLEPPAEYYMSMDDEGLFCLQYDTVNKKYVPTRGSSLDVMFNGPRVVLWYNTVSEYGADNALINLYNEAKKATNKDLKETVDLDKRTYSFTFSGLVLTGNNRPDYYENEVSFTLSENYSITNLKITQVEWENNQADTTHEPTFTTNPETGITTPGMENGQKVRPSSTVIVEIEQTEGERTETNSYKREDFIISSFDVSYNGKVLEDDAVIYCDMKSPKIRLQISNISPELANFDFDSLYLNYEGSFEGDASFVDFAGLTAIISTNELIDVRLNNGGVWTIYLKTSQVTKKITFNVLGKDPTSMIGKIRNDSTGAYYSSVNKLISLNGEVYFYGEVNQYANAVQSATIVSDNADKAKVEAVELDGVKCFKFTATEKGSYSVKVVSNVAPNVFSTFTFEVGDVPDFANILKGEYSVRDRSGNILRLAFAPSGSDGEIKGTFVYTETDKEDNTLTETYSYTVDTDNLIIEVKHVTGEQLYITLSVNASGKLVLTDGYDIPYELEAVE